MKKQEREEQIIDIDSPDVNSGEENTSNDFTLETEETVPDTIKKLRAKLKSCEEEKREYLDGWQRSKADYANAQKRDVEGRVASVKLAKEDILMSLLPVLDSFELAFGSEESLAKIDKNWITGMQQVQVQLLGIMKEQGIKELNPEGEQFDPNLHEPVVTIKTEDKKEDGKILKVVQKGYAVDERVLRAAKVQVAHFE